MTLRLTCGLILLLGMTAGRVAASEAAPRIVSLHVISRRDGWAISGTAAGYHVLRTRDGCRHWKDVSPPGFSAAAPNDWNHDIQQGSVGFDFTDAQDAWLAVDSGQQPHNVMHVYHTADGGRHWTAMRFPTERVGDRTYVQFLDRWHGFILSVSGPAAGLMDKRVYRTRDGGRNWQLTSEVRGERHGYWSFYPSGMTFRGSTEGWITGSYHGEPSFSFLHTRDVGRTWEVQELPIPDLLADGYGNTEPPAFFGKGRRRGVFTAMLANYVSAKGDVEEIAAFFTHDGGKDWRCLPVSSPLSPDSSPLSSPLSPDSSPWFADSRHGWLLYGDASSLSGTHDEGRTWHWLTSHLRRRTIPGIVGYQTSRVDFITARLGWALIVGERDVSLPPEANRPPEIELRRTQDGGRHWHTIHPKQE